VLGDRGTAPPRLTAVRCLENAAEWDERARLAKNIDERKAAREMAEAFRKVAASLDGAKR
jgi:hypothetical protein